MIQVMAGFQAACLTQLMVPSSAVSVGTENRPLSYRL